MNSAAPTSFLRIDAAVRETSPLVHHITNFVVMNFTANITLAAGGQPVMAHAPSELVEMQKFASALVINIGTLDDAWIESMFIAGHEASQAKIPIVLDPVGAGATRLRTDTALRLLDELKVTVLRANAGEIMALAGEAGKVRGVDSTASSDEAVEIAENVARQRGIIVAMTGVEDIVTDGRHTYRVANGDALMGRVTGTGCAASAVTGCYIGTALRKDIEPCEAVAAGLAVYGNAGQIAAGKAEGPGTFVPHLLDALHNAQRWMKPEQLRVTHRVAS